MSSRVVTGKLTYNHVVGDGYLGGFEVLEWTVHCVVCESKKSVHTWTTFLKLMLNGGDGWPLAC